MWVIFALLDPDPDSEATDPIESGSNLDQDPDPQPWLIEVCSVLLTSVTCLTRAKSSLRVYIHPVNFVFCSLGSCFCFVLICVTGLLTTGAFLPSFHIFIWFCICTNIFRNSIRIRVKMSEKSLMVESKEDEAERLHFQKVTLLQVASITNMVQFLLVFRIRRINIGPPRSGLYP